MDSEDFPSTSVTPGTIAPKQLKERIDAGETVTLLDVRSRADYEEWHIEGEPVDSINVPHEAFQGETVDTTVLEAIPDDREVVVLCAQGKASEFVAGRLLERGYDAVQLADGMDGWARIYEAQEVTAYDGTGTLLQYQRPSSGCLSSFHRSV